MTVATVTAEGTTVAYEVTGHGPGVVLVHGLTESRRMWDPLVSPLGTDHTVVTLDLPGHGESGESATYDIDAQVRAVREVVAEVGVANPLLVGHSMGASIVSATAGLLPCRGVINVDQRLEFSTSRAAVAPLESALRGDEATFLATVDATFAPLAGALSQQERARVEGLRRPRQDVVLAVWAPLFDWSPEDLDAYLRQRVAAITAPYLSLHGRDPGAGYADWLGDLIPGATVEVWPNLGHYPHLVDPVRFLDRLRSFEQHSKGST